MLTISEQQIAAKRVSTIQNLNKKFPHWNNKDVETANACLNNLTDYSRNKEGYRMLIENIKTFGNLKLCKKATKFALKIGIN